MVTRRKRSAGLTMIELLIVMALATVGLLGFVSMQRVAIIGNSRARSFNEALGLAQDRLEGFARTPWAQLVAGTTREPTSALLNAAPLLNSQGRTAPEGIYARQTDVVVNGLTARITVTVQFRAEDGSDHAVQVETLRGPN